MNNLKRLAFFIISITIVNFSYSQDFVIKNNGDTLRGIIKEKMFEHLRYSSIKIKLDNGENMVFQPTDLSAFKLGSDYFESVNISKKGNYRQFLRLLVNGHCKLYDYKYTTTSYNGMQSSIRTTYYFQRPNEPLHEYSYVRLMKGIDTYFVDNGSLAFDIKMKKYKKQDVELIVKRYNVEWLSNNEL